MNDSKYGSPLQVRSMRLTEAQYKKYLSLGGSAWLRETIQKSTPDARSAQLRKLRKQGKQLAERLK
jgi:hypothetical protein